MSLANDGAAPAASMPAQDSATASSDFRNVDSFFICPSIVRISSSGCIDRLDIRMLGNPLRIVRQLLAPAQTFVRRPKRAGKRLRSRCALALEHDFPAVAPPRGKLKPRQRDGFEVHV